MEEHQQHDRRVHQRQRQHVLRRAVGPALDDRVAAALGGAQLDPVQIVAVGRQLEDADRGADDQVGGDGRFPGTVGCDHGAIMADGAALGLSMFICFTRKLCLKLQKVEGYKMY